MTTKNLLDSILPAGMLANIEPGNPVAQALEILSKQKSGIAGWEPFHYEKIAADKFDISGAVPEVIGNVKRFPEPHSSVLLYVSEIEAQLEQNGKTVISAVEQIPPTLSNTFAENSGDANPAYLTVVLQLPTDKIGRFRIIDALSNGNDFFGATVIDTSPENELEINRLFIKQCSPEQTQSVREKLKKK